MCDTMFVILLLTGFCFPSTLPLTYRLFRNNVTWSEARARCLSMSTVIVQVHDWESLSVLTNFSVEQNAGKAWIGLSENSSDWTWVDGQGATYLNWNVDEPDASNATEVCATMTDDGYWEDNDCSEVRPSVCSTGDGYTINAMEMNWDDSRTSCENQSSSLVTIPDQSTNSAVQRLLGNGSGVWIGLSRVRHWYWSGRGLTRNATIFNWRTGQPDNQDGLESCVSLVTDDGTWTDEQCNRTYPFICEGSGSGSHTWSPSAPRRTSKITMVRMKVQSRANLEEPPVSAELKEQFQTVFRNLKLHGFKVTWKKLQVKQA